MSIQDEIAAERKRQDEKWGEQSHDPLIWKAILGEELGEADRAILEGSALKYRDEMIQVAAVAQASIESLDRGNLEFASYTKLQAENAVLRSLVEEAEKKSEQYERDWYVAKCEFGESMGKLHCCVEKLEVEKRDLVEKLALKERALNFNADRYKECWEALGFSMKQTEKAKRRVEELEKAARDVLADHQERMGIYPDMNNQPNRIRVMTNLDAVLGESPRRTDAELDAIVETTKKA